MHPLHYIINSKKTSRQHNSRRERLNSELEELVKFKSSRMKT